MVFDGFRYTRDEVFARLKEHDIIARKYFYPLTNDFECYVDTPQGGGERTPVARHIASCVLTPPLYAGLTEEEVDLICDVILGDA